MADDTPPADIAQMRALEFVRSSPETGPTAGQIVYIRCRGRVHTVEVGGGSEDWLEQAIIIWATRLDDRGGAFLASALEKNGVRWNEEVGAFEDHEFRWNEDGGAYDDHETLPSVADVCYAIQREFIEEWRALDVSIWKMNGPTPPDSYSEIDDTVQLQEYGNTLTDAEKGDGDKTDDMKVCVEAMQTLLRRMIKDLKEKHTPIRSFRVEHVETGTVVSIQAFNKAHAFWKWATEVSNGLCDPWDVMDKCLATGRNWAYLEDKDSVYHWAIAVDNSCGYYWPRPVDMMEELAGRYKGEVSIESE